MDIALIAPPWPLFNRPSIQLGALKAYLSRNLPGDLRVRNLHPYLHVASCLGYRDYHAISQSSWASEAVFANILYPGRTGPGLLFKKAMSSRGQRPARLDFEVICKKARAGIENYLDAFDLTKTRLLGISVCLNQLTAGLYVARFIKERYPGLKVAMGGASVSGSIGRGILKAFPFVDFVIDGEGERPLLELARYLLGISNDINSLAVISGDGPKEDSAGPATKDQVPSLDDLPPPDYDDFFRELSEIPGAAGVSVVLPVEASRGCWWGKCTFCNLNLQWKGYRAKGPERVAAEFDHLCKRYSCLDFAFMDNCLPRREAAPMFEKLTLHKRDYGVFAEIRAVHSKKELAQMKEGGLESLQVGIEALSTGVLNRLKKGARTIENLAIMKNCAELGIDLQANIITCFPGTTEDEVEETLRNLEFAWPYPTLKPVRFWLGAESPVFSHFRAFNIRYLKAEKRYSMLFPGEVLENFSPLIFQYVGDRKRQERQWRVVEKRLAFFQKRRKELGIKGSALTYRDGGHFLLIRQLMPDGKVLTHRLSGPSRTIYLHAMEPVKMEEIFSIVPEIPKRKIRDFIVQMASKRLMFSENGSVLSLACKA